MSGTSSGLWSRGRREAIDLSEARVHALGWLRLGGPHPARHQFGWGLVLSRQRRRRVLRSLRSPGVVPRQTIAGVLGVEGVVADVMATVEEGSSVVGDLTWTHSVTIHGVGDTHLAMGRWKGSPTQ